MMTTLKHPVYPGSCNKTSRIINAATTFCCSIQPSTNNIKVPMSLCCCPPASVVINGATKEIGKAAIVAVTKARGMEIAGAVDTNLVGHDAGTVLVHSPAFGLRSVVYVPNIELETVTALSVFCEKASMGCLVAPTLSIGSVLLQQAALQASFHYNNVEIVESRPDSSCDLCYKARGQVLGEDGVRVHSMVLPGLTSTTTVHFSGPGEVCFTDRTSNHKVFVAEPDLWPGEVLVEIDQSWRHGLSTLPPVATQLLVVVVPSLASPTSTHLPSVPSTSPSPDIIATTTAPS
ncbi:hypothetical protein B296_00011974 [Ensete ventricosum]|uniref:Dihydrodipicolinate reductase N-terminal domain-containing protein n=1 Tax=Ensete ventricosum TaxID=4639 RepID=A0A427B4T1_ENSVE|nr:hypothetical protein B296_00011974 [Ensete ventricosum]